VSKIAALAGSSGGDGHGGFACFIGGVNIDIALATSRWPMKKK
jgi:hypothetical protein